MSYISNKIDQAKDIVIAYTQTVTPEIQAIASKRQDVCLLNQCGLLGIRNKILGSGQEYYCKGCKCPIIEKSERVSKTNICPSHLWDQYGLAGNQLLAN